MLDIKFIQENRDLVVQNCINRRSNAFALVDDVIVKYQWLKSEKQALDHYREARKVWTIELQELKDEQEKEEAKQTIRSLKNERIKPSEDEVKKLEEEIKELLYQIPNLTSPHSPVGETEEDNRVLKVWIPK